MFKKITIFTVITILALLLLSVLLSAWPYVFMYPLEDLAKFIIGDNGGRSPKFILETFSYHLKVLSFLINLLWVLIGAYVAYKASSLAKRYLDIKEKERN